MRMMAIVILGVTVAPTMLTQPSGDPARAVRIGVMRVINTAEAAARHQTGKYLLLPDLLNHEILSRIRADIVANGDVITYKGQQLRITLSPDATQYQAMVMPAETCGTAIFSDERGLIYAGKVLDC